MIAVTLLIRLSNMKKLFKKTKLPRKRKKAVKKLMRKINESGCLQPFKYNV